MFVYVYVYVCVYVYIHIYVYINKQACLCVDGRAYQWLAKHKLAGHSGLRSRVIGYDARLPPERLALRSKR